MRRRQKGNQEEDRGFVMKHRHDVDLLDAVGYTGIQRIKLIRRNIHKTWKTKRICKLISCAINHEFGLAIVIGSRRNRHHWWNLLPDGVTILDASADQYGDRGISLFSPEDKIYSEYKSNPPTGAPHAESTDEERNR